MNIALARRAGGRRLLLGAIAAALTATALLAVGILLAGDFGETEGRILGTTLLVAAYGLLALPAGLLVDQRRLAALAATVLGLALAGFALAVAAIWTPDAPDALGKTSATITVFAVAFSQTAALVARRRPAPAAVRRLFALSVALVLVVATMVTVLVWAELDGGGYARILAAVAVLDVLVVALQPILTLARARPTVYALRVAVEDDGEVATIVEAADFATAAARAIRSVERSGRHTVGVSRGR